MDRVPTIDVGVLGVVFSDPEVIAVFPELSATILPHAQEIRFYRGDDIAIGVLGEYIARIYDEVKRRPLYVASRILDHAHDGPPPSDTTANKPDA